MIVRLPMKLRHVDPARPAGVIARAYAAFGASRFARFISRHVNWKLDPLLLRATRGRFATTLFFPAAVLETRGARSGERRRNAIIYFHDGDRVTIVASNAGSPTHPAWYHNLRAHPDVTFGGIPMRATVVEDDAERERLWVLADRVFPAYARFRRETAELDRTIPIVQLTERGGARVTLVRAELATMDAALEGDDALARVLGCAVVPGWVSFTGALAATRVALAADPAAEWGTRLFLAGEPPELVGWGGFKGPPRDGVVELGYEVAAGRWGQGLATGAARAMLAEAFADTGVTAVIAHTVAERNASNRVLEKVGFRFDGQAVEDGQDVWRFRRDRTDPGSDLGGNHRPDGH